MEKEIIVLVSAIMLFIVIVILLKFIPKGEDEFIYVHTKTGNRYKIIQKCKMKYANKWMNAIIYISEEDGETYVRECEDFMLNFKRLS